MAGGMVIDGIDEGAWDVSRAGVAFESYKEQE